jgi:D-alanine transaminase
MTLCCLNGVIGPLDAARISPLDRGFLFGDGVYEVLAHVDGVTRARQLHQARLAQSLARIRLESAVSIDAIFADMDRLLAASALPSAKIYLQVTRGVAPERDHRFPSQVIPTVFLMATAWSPTVLGPQAAIIAPDIRWQWNAIKSTSLLANVLLQQQASEAGAVDALLHRDGWLTEASTSNAFVIDNGALLTPPLSDRLLPGVTRHLVLDLAREHGLHVIETEIAIDQLSQAELVMITSSTRGLVPITRLLPDQTIGCGEIPAIFETLQANYQRVLHAHP